MAAGGFCLGKEVRSLQSIRSWAKVTVYVRPLTVVQPPLLTWSVLGVNFCSQERDLENPRGVDLIGITKHY